MLIESRKFVSITIGPFTICESAENMVRKLMSRYMTKTIHQPKPYMIDYISKLNLTGKKLK